MKNYTKHKLNFLPEMSGDDYTKLLNDMRNFGFDRRYPIVIYQDCILDGWNRYRACLELDIEAIEITFNGDDFKALELVLRSNNRRHLNSDQKAAVAVRHTELFNTIRLEALKNQKSGQYCPINNKIDSSEMMAKLFNTSRTYINEAKKLEQEDPESFDALLAGTKSLYQINKEKKSVLPLDNIVQEVRNPQLPTDLFDEELKPTYRGYSERVPQSGYDLNEIKTNVKNFINSDEGMKELPKEEYNPTTDYRVLLSRDCYDKVKELSESNRRTMSQVIEAIIDKYTNKEHETAGQDTNGEWEIDPPF